jgi:hypothetical protein
MQFRMAVEAVDVAFVRFCFELRSWNFDQAIATDVDFLFLRLPMMKAQGRRGL